MADDVSSIAGIPSAFDAALERVRKFAVEWKIAQRRGTYSSTVYELHPGDPRHAICDIDDLIWILNVASAQGMALREDPQGAEGEACQPGPATQDAPTPSQGQQP